MIDTIMISLSLFFVVIGALISALSALGILRLRDVYGRAHAAGKASTLGSMSLLLGCSYISLVKTTLLTRNS